MCPAKRGAAKPKPKPKPKRKRAAKPPAPVVHKNLANFCLWSVLERPAWAPEGAQVSYWNVSQRTQYLFTHAGREVWADSLDALEAACR